MTTGPEPLTRPAARWRAPPDVPDRAVEALVRFSGLPRPICELLARRDLEPGGPAEQFLRPRLESLHAPHLLPDMSRAADRIESAIEAGEKIFIHGDYDVDGMTAAALLAGALQDLGGDATPFVPHRTRDGYDLGAAGIEVARRVRASLIVTADCGITAVDAVAEAARAGIDVIVTDHHRPGPSLPDAVAIVNPNRQPHDYPFRGLAGVGVAFKLVQELFARKGFEGDHLNRYLDLVALGTIADQAPLVDENRVLTWFGMKVLNRTRRPGLQALMRVAKVGRWSAPRASDVAFRLAPRLNSTGRIGEASDGLRLVSTEDVPEAERLARDIDRINIQRREADRGLLSDARRVLELDFDSERDRIVVLWAAGWHPGILGIAASKLVDDLGRPVVLIGVHDGRGRGSARSIPDFHLFEALESCRDLFDRFGGHAVAAGFDISADRLPELRTRLQAFAAARLPAEQLVPEIGIDLEIRLEDLTPAFARGFSYLEPFGVGNEMPRLVIREARFRGLETVGADGEHLKGRLDDGSETVEAIAFGLGARETELGNEIERDFVFELHVEETARGRRVQAHVIAIGDPA